jgi:hypothetical protein
VTSPVSTRQNSASGCLSPELATPKGCGSFGPGPGAAPGGRCTGRFGEVLVVAAVGPETQSDPRGFDQAVRRAVGRLAKVEEG